MSTLIEKINLLVSASLHDLVNEALKAKNVAVLREQIRRLGESREDVDETIASVTADLRIERDKNAGLIETIAIKKERATTLKGKGKLSQAAILVKEYMAKEESLKKSSASIVEMEAELGTLEQAGLMIDAKKSELESALADVERALKIAKTKRRTVKNLEDVAKLLEEDSGPNIGEWAQHEKVVADVQLEQAMAKHGHLLKAEDDPDVAAELEKL